MRELVLVGMGGALGSVARYSVGQSLAALGAHLSFPISTMVVNIVGSFLMGVLVALTREGVVLTQEVRLLCATGVLGGFTTFSAFSGETLALMREGAIKTAMLNFLATPVVCLLAAVFGLSIAQLCYSR